MSTQNGTSGDAAAIIEAARRATHVGDRVMLVEGPDKQKYPVAIQSDGRVGVFQELLLVMDQRSPRPLRATGRSIHVEAASFIAHVNRHKVANSVIFCDPVLFSFTAIYNYNEPSLQVLPPVKLEPPVPSGEGGIEIAEGVQMPLDCNTRPGFGDFRAEYACPRSPEWVLWTKAANEMMSSEVFAELIEANTKDIIQVEGSPTPAALLGLARDLKVDTRKLVGRKYNPTTGEMNIQYVEENVEGSTKIPEKFWIGVPIFLNGKKRYPLEWRIRMRFENSKPTFGFIMQQKEVVAADAFAEAREEIKNGTNLPLFAGKPEY